MKGKLVKKEGEWFIEYLEHGNKVLMPIHPGELRIPGLWKLKNKEIEFDVKKEYKGFKWVGEKDERSYIEIYQNYAKLKIE